MAVDVSPSQARAVAVFNPTAPAPGFLQPLLVGMGGDNRSFVQVVAAPGRLAGFAEVAWPDRDFIALNEEPVLQIGGEPLWGFLFPDEPPLVALWSTFRETMRTRVGDPKLAEKPLQLFDIVDTLDFDEFKPSIYVRAYRAYTEMGPTAANRWRDRSILEPALARILPALGLPSHRTTVVDGPTGRTSSTTPRLRARLTDGELLVFLEGAIGEAEQRGFQDAYDQLVAQYPDLFADGVRVIATHPPRRAGPPQIKAEGTTVVLVGRIREGQVSYDEWISQGVEVADESRFHPALRIRRVPKLTILLGAQPDWPQLVEAGIRMGEHAAVIVSLSTSAAPMLRDLEFQAQTNLPTITFFAPYATSTVRGRDPVAPIRPILEIVKREMEGAPFFDVHRLLKAQHNMLVREPISSNQTSIELACRLAARALKAGAVLGGAARLYSQGAVRRADHQSFAAALAHLFEIEESEPVHIEARRAALLLLVERIAQNEPSHYADSQRQGIMRLFELRGWRIGQDHGRAFDLEDDQRRFSVVIVDHARDVPAEDPEAAAPGLTRAPLLVIHVEARREQLLIGNRGQFFHAAIEDIALIEPGTLWVWKVLSRQLFEAAARPSQGALRLCASLIVEAVRQRRIQRSLSDIDWNHIQDLLTSSDCERFIRFVDRRTPRRTATLVIQIADKSGSDNQQIAVDLTIEDDGPVVQGTDFTELPFD
ncbi:hypothetical protein [Stakelama pacifica]|uniref:Uncharacterized protein n=1 Tax=Stakelama pacifica TaxID=517720 RepID=A0A4R6FPG8_9SPHN|nr:hypothetical protein [Stakelama pacifica]TDN83556.1 hypothetical protein EV664_10439 [Stakelama pacifica]GGO94162.1 hypothetical protein GCM10011329_15290 [Stakelama pacifica]